MDLNKYLVDASSVGDWGGQEQLAAHNLNRIYHALDLRICPILIVGDERQWNPGLYGEIMSHVWRDWMHKDMLLNLTDERLKEYVESMADYYHIQAVPPYVVDNVEITVEQALALSRSQPEQPRPRH